MRSCPKLISSQNSGMSMGQRSMFFYYQLKLRFSSLLNENQYRIDYFDSEMFYQRGFINDIALSFCITFRNFSFCFFFYDYNQIRKNSFKNQILSISVQKKPDEANKIFKKLSTKGMRKITRNYHTQKQNQTTLINLFVFCKVQLARVISRKVRRMDAQKIDKKISKAVALVSKSEKYQRKLFIFLLFCWVQNALCALINAMVFTNPLFFCEGVKSTEAYSCSHLDQCEYTNNFTGTYYAGLFCQKRGIRMTIQTLMGLGCIVGVFIMPVVSDLKGKKMATNLSLLQILTGYVLVFLGIYMKNYLFCGLGQFVSSFGVISMSVISYSLNSDFFSDDLRQKAIIYYCAAWGLTDMSILLVYTFQPYWMFYVIFLLIIPEFILYAYFRSFFLQSPNYLIISKHDYHSAIQMIEQLSLANQASEAQTKQAVSLIRQIEQIQGLGSSNKNQEKQFTETIQIILKSPKYLKATICLIFIKMAYYCFYYCVQGSLERVGFNFGISVFLLGCGQFTGYITGTKFIPKMKRRTVLLITNILTSAIGLLCLIPAVERTPILVSLVLYLCYTLTSYYFSAVTLVETESYSSSVRSTGVGIAFGVSYLSRLAVPFAIGFLNERGIHSIAASSALVLLLGVVPILIVDETYGFTNLEEPLLAQDMQVKNTTEYFQLQEKSKKVEQE